jgi:DNA-binding response OmpR family regulator
MKELQQMNVFVVDDEAVIAETLATILRISGFLAISFTSPLDALNWTRTIVPELLITDVVMPEMSGIELAITTKALCADCKVLLFLRTSCNRRVALCRKGRGSRIRGSLEACSSERLTQ